MTLLLAHPPAEDLGRFVEGTLPDSERTAVVAHIADCDECRILVVDATAYGETLTNAATGPLRNWWIAVAAAIVLVVGVGYHIEHRNPLAKLAGTYGQLTFAPVEGRLSGFPYVPTKKATRGGSEDELDPDSYKLGEPAADVLERRGDDAETRHAHGIAHLVLKERLPAVEELTAATREAPQEATYWSDLSAAQIANGDAAHALESADQALRLHADLPDALFNRALALETLGRTEAVSAYERYAYVDVDPKSQWRDEARKRASDLRSRGD
jgi:hypothetical protein